MRHVWIRHEEKQVRNEKGAARVKKDDERAQKLLPLVRSAPGASCPGARCRAKSPTLMRSGCRKSCCSRPRSRPSADYYRKFLELWPKCDEARRRAHRGGDAGLGGAGLLFARPQSPRLRAENRGAPYGGVFPSDEAELRGLAGDRSLYGGGGRGHRLRAPRHRGRRQYRARRVAAAGAGDAAARGQGRSPRWSKP